MPAMGTNFADPERRGFVSEKHLAYYKTRARGGAGLITLEATSINPVGSPRRYGISLDDDRFIPGLRELSDVIKAGGAKSGIQFNYGGRIGPPKINPAGKAIGWGPRDGYFAVSALPHPITGAVPKPFTVEQIEVIRRHFVEASLRAKEAGFDVIEILGGHGYLLNEFVSPRTNRREDAYGGDIKGRMRFPLEVVRDIEKAIGSYPLLSYRLSAVDFQEGGLELDDSLVFARALDEAGVPIIHVSAGINETAATINRVIAPMPAETGGLARYAKMVKERVKARVITVQRITTPDLAEKILADAAADLVAVGRGLIADPQWPVKALKNCADEICQCVGCNQGCIERLVQELPIRCLQNPEVGREEYSPRGTLTGGKKKVLIVGGGISGMEAARVLASLGHAVTLVEKNARLGGTARMAAVLKERREFLTIVRNLERQLAALPVKVELNRAVDTAGIREDDYDAIIVATGAMPMMPNRFEVSGDQCEVLTFREVLAEPNRSFARATVVGGGSVGVEVALLLVENGADVTIVEMAEDICQDMGPLNKTWMKDATANRCIHVLTDTLFERLGPEGLVLKKDSVEIVEPTPEALVVAIGSKPAPLLFPAGWTHVHYVGDCVRVGNAMDAIHSAYYTAMEVACLKTHKRPARDLVRKGN